MSEKPKNQTPEDNDHTYVQATQEAYWRHIEEQPFSQEAQTYLQYFQEKSKPYTPGEVKITIKDFQGTRFYEALIVGLQEDAPIQAGDVRTKITDLLKVDTTEKTQLFRPAIGIIYKRLTDGRFKIPNIQEFPTISQTDLLDNNQLLVVHDTFEFLDNAKGKQTTEVETEVTTYTLYEAGLVKGSMGIISANPMLRRNGEVSFFADTVPSFAQLSQVPP